LRPELFDPAPAIERFTVALDDRSAEQFDGWIAKRSYSNRSEAVRELLRAELGKATLQAAATQTCVACLSSMFNHPDRQLAERLASLRHDHHDLTISTIHAHLDHEQCLKTVPPRGKVSAVMHLADGVCAERDVTTAR
jgi:CopG family nickel-responsive transcriptional regulator